MELPMKRSRSVSPDGKLSSGNLRGVVGKIGYTVAASPGNRNGVVVGAANFPLNLATFQAQHGSLPVLAAPSGTAWENDLVPTDVVINNGRLEEHKIETRGFELVSGLSGSMSPAASLDIKAYLGDVERISTSLMGATAGFAYCHAARAPKRPNLGDSNTRAGYASYAHTDQAHFSWGPRLPELVGVWDACGPPGVPKEIATRAARSRRYAIVSAWRYLGPERFSRHSHLAVLDPTSVAPDDILHFEIRTTVDTSGSNYRLDSTKAKNHAWWYYPQMDRDDQLLFFVVYDSNATFANAQVTPAPTVFHSAFIDPSGHDAPDRESMDVRVLLIWD